jgi:DNA-binding transcriptional ArsR family regulator
MDSYQALASEAVDAVRAGPSISAAAELFKAVAHPVRAQILELLSQGESSIAELCEGTGVKASHLSRHLNQMRGQQLIQCRWTGGRLVYSAGLPASHRTAGRCPVRTSGPDRRRRRLRGRRAGGTALHGPLGRAVLCPGSSTGIPFGHRGRMPGDSCTDRLHPRGGSRTAHHHGPHLQNHPLGSRPGGTPHG